MDGMVKHARLVAFAETTDTVDLSAEGRHNMKQFVATCQDGKPHLVKTGRTLHLGDIHEDFKPMHDPPRDHENLLVELLKTMGALLLQLPSLLQSYFRHHTEARSPFTVKVVKTAYVGSVVSDMSSLTLEST